MTVVDIEDENAGRAVIADVIVRSGHANVQVAARLLSGSGTQSAKRPTAPGRRNRKRDRPAGTQDCRPGLFPSRSRGAYGFDRRHVDAIVVRPPDQEASHFHDAADRNPGRVGGRDQKPECRQNPMSVAFAAASSSAAGWGRPVRTGSVVFVS